MNSLGITVTAHQSSYLPWLGFFHKLALSDIYVYLDDVQYEKNSFTNRNKVKSPNGAEIWLTVPVLSKDHFNRTVKDLKIDNNSKWRIKHWKTLQTYKKAPYFQEYSDFLEKAYSKDWEYLSEMNEYLLKFFLKELNINVKFIKSSELGLKQKKADLVIEICEKLDAEIFIFGALGKNYAKVDDFTTKGINVYFQDYRHPVYPQLWGDFVYYLSIVDLLFNVGSEKANKIIMKDNIDKDKLIKMVKLGQERIQ